MLRYFFKLFLFVSLCLSQTAFAQTGDAEPATLPIGDAGWCTITREAGPGSSECGFQSAEAACERMISSFYPKGSRIFSGLTESNVCKLEEIDTSLELGIGTAAPALRCQSGYSRAGATCRQIASCSTCDPTQHVGNPINFLTGEKKDVRVDYQSADGKFVIKRYYNSAPFGSNGNVSSMKESFGHNWFLGHFPSLGADITHFKTNSNYLFSFPTGYSTRFGGRAVSDGTAAGVGILAAGQLVSPFRVEHPDAQVEGADRRVWVTHKNGTRYNFDFPPLFGTLDLRGFAVKPVSVDLGEGYSQNFEYDDEGTLLSITDTYGRQASFEYYTVDWRVQSDDNNDVMINGISYDVIFDGDGRSLGDERQPETGKLRKITFPDGTYAIYEYGYVSEFNAYWDIKDRLEAVVKYDSDGTEIRRETYHYEDIRLPYGLTGITDDAGIRFATYSYDDHGRANMSQHDGGVNRVDIEYQTITNFSAVGERKVTNSLGRTKTHTHYARSSNYQLASTDGESTDNVLPTRETYDYPTSGGVRSKVDALSRTERTDRNSRGLPITKRYAVGTSEDFTATYVWHERFNRPTQTVHPGLTTDYVYDDEGRIESMTQTDTTPNLSPARIWAYTWDGSNLASVDGPLPGDIDVTHFEHQNEKLLSVENEVGHITEITNHNPIGAPSSFTDPNGVVTTLKYDVRHRLETITRQNGITKEDAVTEIKYSPTDLTTSITLPNGNRLGFQYNDARQLIAITNGADERVDYTRNAMGGILSTKIPDSSGAIQYSMTQVRDELNRVVEAIGVDWNSHFAYDEMNNLTNITDPRENKWEQSFDNLDRLKSELDPLGGVASYDLNDQMDARNPLNKVTDERGVETQYVRNGYGEVIREISLEAGTTEYVRDAAGRITQMTDARGVVSNYVYDGMDRVLSVTYPTAEIDDIEYVYDEGTFGIGELTSITEGFGETTYAYNELAQMTRMTRIINGVSYVCEYEYDLAGEVTAIIYPSGRRIEYARDGAAREIRILMVSPDGTTTILADNISYKPFGPIDAMSLGDGHDLSISYDTNYRALRLTRSGSAGQLMDLGFTYNKTSDITGLQDYIRPDRSQIFDYDALSRLTDADGGYGTLSYDYNAGGDRTARAWTQPDGELTSERYTYDTLTARLSLVDVEDTAGQFTPIREFDYHASGQVSSDLRGANEYLYGLNDRGRLTTITRNGDDVARYIHDASEQRIAKTANGQTIHYHYDLDGRLTSETDGITGATLREYVWLGLMPIAVIDGTGQAPDTACEDDIAELQANIAARTAQIDQNTAEIAQLAVLSDDLMAEIAALEAAIADTGALVMAREASLASAAQALTAANALVEDRTRRIAFLEAQIARINPRRTVRIAGLQARLNVHVARLPVFEARVAAAEANIAEQTPLLEAAQAVLETQNLDREALNLGLAEQAAEREALSAESLLYAEERDLFEAELIALEATCETDAAGGLYYLHADHLGRPQFATDTSGAVVWDMGEGVTPFGDSVNLAGAFAQQLMFPGQYADVETGDDTTTLSHNWHRTYDPTLGRYLQSDPIGLAGGLNRFAYVGGNPTSYVDPDGQIFFLAPLAIPLIAGVISSVAIDLLIQTQVEGKSLGCVNLTSLGVSAGLGLIPGGSFVKPFKALKVGLSQQKRFSRVVSGFTSSRKSEALDQLGLSVIALEASTLLGMEIPKFLPEKTIRDNCECNADVQGVSGRN